MLNIQWFHQFNFYYCLILFNYRRWFKLPPYFASDYFLILIFNITKKYFLQLNNEFKDYFFNSQNLSHTFGFFRYLGNLTKEMNFKMFIKIRKPIPG